MNTAALPLRETSRFWPKLGWALMLIGALAAAGNAILFMLIEPYGTHSIKERFFATAIAGWAHTMGGSLAAVLGPFQFLSSVRRQYPRVHVWIGRVYLAAVATSGLAGFFFSQSSIAGITGVTGFGVLAVFWLVSGTLAYVHIRRGNVAEHRRWMIRNYALTFAAVTLRIELPLLMIAGLKFVHAFRVVAWSCWVPNWVVVETWLQRRRTS
jgi:uncharacterized membrane protein